jgi:2-oxo-4-hydroxy-4-carboxy-5-ureidoimidazoline decarboxylase
MDADLLLTACSSTRWAGLVASQAPFETTDALLEAAERAFDELGPDDWHQGIRGHARIAEVPSDDPREAEEQAGIEGADPETLAALHAGNAAYEARFGYMFLIRASGRGAAEMLAALNDRLDNPPATEFQIATEQLREITRLRLRELVP